MGFAGTQRALCTDAHREGCSVELRGIGTSGAWMMGFAPQVMAALGALVIGVLNRNRAQQPINLAAALRYHSRDPDRPLATLGISLGFG